MGPATAPASSGPGDPETENELENELIDVIADQEHYRRFPWTHYASSDNASDASSDYMNDSDHEAFRNDYNWDMYYGMLTEEDILLTMERDEEGIYDDHMRLILKAREAEEWPEDMPKQWDETTAQAQRRHNVLQAVRQFTDADRAGANAG